MAKRIEEADLLTCPFCGAVPTIEPWHGGKKTKRMVACDSEACYVAPSVTGETFREAVDKWNMRSAPTVRVATTFKRE